MNRNDHQFSIESQALVTTDNVNICVQRWAHVMRVYVRRAQTVAHLNEVIASIGATGWNSERVSS